MSDELTTTVMDIPLTQAHASLQEWTTQAFDLGAQQPAVKKEIRTVQGHVRS